MISWLTAVFMAATLPGIEIQGVQPIGLDTPVRFGPVPASLRGADQNLEIRIPTGAGEKIVPIQILPEADSAVLIIPPQVEFAASKPLSLQPATTGMASRFSFKNEEGRLWVYEQDRPVLGYNYGDQLKEGVPEDRRRSSYIHPLYGLDGEMLTDDFPRDHYHHRGLFWAWPRVKLGDQAWSLWDIRDIYSRFEDWIFKQAGPVCAAFGVKNGWYTNAGKLVEERVEVIVYASTPAGQALDVALQWRALQPGVRINGAPDRDKGYGGLCYRASPRTETEIVTAHGREKADSDHNHVSWADMSAFYVGRPTRSGLAIFSHPKNPDDPPAWTLRFYGFLGPVWPGLEEGEIPSGDTPLTMQYRVWIHRGDVDAGRTADAWTAYTNTLDCIRFVTP